MALWIDVVQGNSKVRGPLVIIHWRDTLIGGHWSLQVQSPVVSKDEKIAAEVTLYL